MSVYQVKLVYLSPALNSPTGAPAILHLTEPSGFNVLSSISADNQSKLCEPHQIQLNTQLPSLRNTQTGTPTSVDMPGSPHATRAQNSSRNGPCVEGEIVELYFSLYNNSESRFMTKECCTILNHISQPQISIAAQSRHSQHTPMSYDISPHDFQDSIFLVCQLVKNGAMKTVTGQAHHNSISQSMQEAPHNLSVSSGTLRQSGLFKESNGMTLTNSKSGTQSVRWPYGCAVAELAQFSSQSN
ncbi:hypothetical protein PSTG_05410 [Puccinia striiformis f. sp. tritici PST-78]|uniref:Dedicator of cytokinesis N-terminal domain-containing protein n=1 Tax=Puccinia striiformis f. sp. tritici PST-78 TaxID=1165861 RepID=A0A0L0VPV9_9BASI|nr:hypothetical protein PSTG_05410 [Puccinia striiformis f. sp. tritici PST-78]